MDSSSRRMRIYVAPSKPANATDTTVVAERSPSPRVCSAKRCMGEMKLAAAMMQITASTSVKRDRDTTSVSRNIRRL